MKKEIGVVFLSALFVLMFLAVPAFAQEEAMDPVAGCQSVAVDPEASLELQQAVCRAAEQNSASSCSAGGAGLCSSPKMNDMMVAGTNCVCVYEDETLSAEAV